jgi:cell division septum initiation protein DivIVA
MRPADFAHHVTNVEFGRTLFGYRPVEVRGHLDLVKGWFVLAGIEDVLAGIEEQLEERISELEGEAERRRRDAEADSARMVEEARREAEQIRSTARQEADALLAEARREAELERRGRSRIGRPVGDGRFVALIRR